MANSTNATNEIPVTVGVSGSVLPTSIAIFLSSLNFVLSITASLGNVLILIALQKVSSICPPTKLLLRCLAVTDLCVGLFTHPLSAFVLLGDIFNLYMKFNRLVNRIITIAFYLSLFTLPLISVLTSAAISVDRLLALLLRLRYRQVVTLRRVRAVALCFCSIGILCGALFITSCVLYFKNLYLFLFQLIFFSSIILSLVTSICSYTKIFFTLRRQQAQLHRHINSGQPNGGGNPLNIARYKKTVYTVAWIQLTILVCYAPFIIMTMRFINNYGSFMANVIAFSFGTCLVNLNSSLNPIIYCWRIKDVRQQVKNILRKCASC